MQVLWLADNCIASLNGLSTLGRLRELNVARNDILYINDCLSENTSLEVLNLADNCIGSFKVWGAWFSCSVVGSQLACAFLGFGAHSNVS